MVDRCFVAGLVYDWDGENEAYVDVSSSPDGGLPFPETFTGEGAIYVVHGVSAINEQEVRARLAGLDPHTKGSHRLGRSVDHGMGAEHWRP